MTQPPKEEFSTSQSPPPKLLRVKDSGRFSTEPPPTKSLQNTQRIFQNFLNDYPTDTIAALYAVAPTTLQGFDYSL